MLVRLCLGLLVLVCSGACRRGEVEVHRVRPGIAFCFSSSSSNTWPEVQVFEEVDGTIHPVPPALRRASGGRFCTEPHVPVGDGWRLGFRGLYRVRLIGSSGPVEARFFSRTGEVRRQTLRHGLISRAGTNDWWSLRAEVPPTDPPEAVIFPGDPTRLQ